MGVRQDNLIKFLSPFNKVEILVAKPQPELYMKSDFFPDLIKIYRMLGGRQSSIPFTMGKFDYVINGMIVELDEENHFNRYRALTLHAPIYEMYTIVEKQSYLAYCKQKENKCQARGGYWSNSSSDKWFGVSSSPGNLNGDGPSRWKQRAFYDLLKDHIPVVSGIPIKRISIYDEVMLENGKSTIGIILQKGEIRHSRLIYNILFS